MIKLFTIKQKLQWEAVVKSFKDYDIYFSPQYFIPFMKNGDGIPIAFYYEGNYGRVLHSFLLRDISKDKNLNSRIAAGHYFDISTVYGYGGPLFECSEENLDNLSKEFYDSFEKYCKDNNIISEFIRFHPVLKNERFSKNHMIVENIRKTVYVDLTKGIDCLSANITYDCRRAIRKAKNHKVIVKEGRNEKYLLALCSLYKSTMDKNNANNYYYFNDSFFKDTLETLKDNSTIFVALYDDKIIASSLVIYTNKYCHHHFSGSNKEFLKFHPNNLLTYEILNWCIDRGFKGFHTGGGHSSSEDSLYRFKKSFTKDPPLDFNIGKKIYNNQLYNWLLEKNLETTINLNDNNYFPLYRHH